MTKRRLKIVFIIFLVLGLLTLINRVTYFVIYFGIGLNQAGTISTEKIAKIIVANNYITNIWYVYLIIAGIFYWLYRKQSTNTKVLITKEVKMDKDEKKKPKFTWFNWLILVVSAPLMVIAGLLALANLPSVFSGQATQSGDAIGSILWAALFIAAFIYEIKLYKKSK